MPDEENSFWQQGRVIGILIGLILGLSLIIIGLWKTLIVAATTSVGYIIGRFYDERLDLEVEEFDAELEEREYAEEMEEETGWVSIKSEEVQESQELNNENEQNNEESEEEKIEEKE
jgi:uncharacterized membrane protein